MCISVTNTIYDTNPSFLHAPGKTEFNPLWSQNFYNDVALRRINCDNTTIITWSSDDQPKEHKIKDIFLSSLEKYGIDVTKLIQNPWYTNRIKTKLTLNHLESVDTEYVIGGDNFDVVFTGTDFNPHDVLKEYDCDLLFNAEKKFWPPEFESMEYAQKSMTHPPFCYLNAGLWVGKREFCIDFFNDVLKYDKLPIHMQSEQVCVHLSYMKHFPLVKIDYKCLIFQNLNRVNSDEVIIEHI